MSGYTPTSDPDFYAVDVASMRGKTIDLRNGGKPVHIDTLVIGWTWVEPAHITDQRPKRRYMLKPATPLYVKLAILLAVLFAIIWLLPVKCFGQTRPVSPVGVWAQPAASFPRWKALGVNVLVGYDGGGNVTKAAWEKAAADSGLWFIDEPGTDLATEAKQPFRFGWMQADEPDLNRFKDGQPNPELIDAGRYKGWRKPELLATRYTACKAAAPTLPVFVNFAGPSITPVAYTHGEGHMPYIAAADLLCMDWHIKNANADRYPVTLVGQALDRLKVWSNGKPMWSYIEVSQHRYDATSRCPTPDEVEAMIKEARAHGATGLVLFAHSFKNGWDPTKRPNGWDGIPADIETRLQTLLNPKPTTQPTTQPTLADVLQRLDRIEAKVDGIANHFKP